MKTISLFASFLISALICSSTLFGQDLNANYTAIKQKIVEVKIDQTTFQPSFEVLDAEKGKLNYTLTEVDEKGKAKKEGFEFYLSDIDKNTIVRNVSGKKMIVSLSINNNQKFIKYLVDNNHDSYVSKIDILVQNADEGQKIMDLLKASIPMIKSTEKTWNSNTEALNWLKSNIGEVKTKAGVSAQTFTFGERKDYLVNYTSVKTDLKGVNTTDKYEFNTLDLNKNGIALKISGAQLTINVESKGGDKFFKHFKNNVFHGFDNSFEIEASDIDQARNIISALNVAHLKSKAQFKTHSSLESATEFIKGNSADYKFDDKTFKQKFDFKMGSGTKATISLNESDLKGKSVDIVNYIYLDDIEISSLKLKISGPKVLLLGTIKGNMDFVKVTKDVEIQNYDNEFEWIFTDIETAREVMDALIYSIKASETKPMTWSSVSDAISFLSNNVKGETIQKDMYKLYFTGESMEPFRCEYTRNKRDEKSSIIDHRFVFYPFTLDAASVKIKSSGKFLNINALVAKNNPLSKPLKTINKRVMTTN
ncbi:MAG: hypothetical protein IPK03_13385 [Bacteroidetes bacterium]|nr:hypothetical protein [Bacteroidota bacterium]